MLITVSPSTTLDFASESSAADVTQPIFGTDAELLMSELKRWSAADIIAKMKVSEALAAENVQRFAAWEFPHAAAVAKPAIHAFKGSVYAGLKAETFDADTLAYSQDHLRIFNGLYGMLRPLDLIQPYRLDFKAKFDPPGAKNLYHYWWDKIDAALLSAIEAQGDNVLIDLTSGEYGRLIRAKALPDVRIVSVNFREWRNGQYKLVSTFAKQARGFMARYLLEKRVSSVEGLKNFSDEGYRYNPDLSQKDRLIFTRGGAPDGVI